MSQIDYYFGCIGMLQRLWLKQCFSDYRADCSDVVAGKKRLFDVIISRLAPTMINFAEYLDRVDLFHRDQLLQKVARQFFRR